MKVEIIQANGKKKTCPNCKHDIFRLSKNRCSYSNKEKTKGTYRDIEICDKCGRKEEFNIMPFEAVLT